MMSRASSPSSHSVSLAQRVTRRSPATLAAAMATAAIALPALSDPCKAIPDRGPMPAYLSPGSTFSGPVAHIGDGDSLCVAVGPGRESLVEVRIADFYAPELSAPGGATAKQALSDIAYRRTVTCRAQHRSHDRVVAVCRLGGRSLGDHMRRAGIREGGNGR